MCDLGLMLSSIPVVLLIRDLVSPKLSNAQCLQGCSAQAVLDEVSPDFSRFCTCCCTSRVHAVCLHAEHVCTHSLVATVCEGQDVYKCTSSPFSIHLPWLGQLGVAS